MLRNCSFFIPIIKINVWNEKKKMNISIVSDWIIGVYNSIRISFVDRYIVELRAYVYGEYVESGIELQLHLVAYVKICFKCQYSIIRFLLVMQELIKNISARMNLPTC